MFMRSAHLRFLQVLSTAVLATLFLCQVVGSLCPMMPTAGATAATVHEAHAGHTMEGSGKCLDSLPSSPKSFGTPDMHQLTPLESWQAMSCLGPSALSVHAADVFPADSGPPLYARLSTFRI